jgi:hypothetical protein
VLLRVRLGEAPPPPGRLQPPVRLRRSTHLRSSLWLKAPFMLLTAERTSQTLSYP